MLETDIAYVAGIVDGEGCIRIKKMRALKCQGRKTPAYHATIKIKMVDQGVVDFVASVLDGRVTCERNSLKSGRPFFACHISDKKAENAIRLILPFLRAKRRQAEKVLELRELQKGGAKHRTKVVGFRNFPNQHGTPRQVKNLSFSDEYVARCESLFQDIKVMNRVGVTALG
jgi:hypothetical protein